MQENKCDVLVVGAGPAGCSAAFFSKFLDDDDKREVVLLERLDKQKFLRYHDMYGEFRTIQSLRVIEQGRMVIWKSNAMYW